MKKISIGCLTNFISNLFFYNWKHISHHILYLWYSYNWKNSKKNNKIEKIWILILELLLRFGLYYAHMELKKKFLKMLLFYWLILINISNFINFNKHDMIVWIYNEKTYQKISFQEDISIMLVGKEYHL